MGISIGISRLHFSPLATTTFGTLKKKNTVSQSERLQLDSTQNISNFLNDRYSAANQLSTSCHLLDPPLPSSASSPSLPTSSGSKPPMTSATASTARRARLSPRCRTVGRRGGGDVIFFVRLVLHSAPRQGQS